MQNSNRSSVLSFHRAVPRSSRRFNLTETRRMQFRRDSRWSRCGNSFLAGNYVVASRRFGNESNRERHTQSGKEKAGNTVEVRKNDAIRKTKVYSCHGAVIFHVTRHVVRASRSPLVIRRCCETVVFARRASNLARIKGVAKGGTEKGKRVKEERNWSSCWRWIRKFARGRRRRWSRQVFAVRYTLARLHHPLPLLPRIVLANGNRPKYL